MNDITYDYSYNVIKNVSGTGLLPLKNIENYLKVRVLIDTWDLKNTIEDYIEESIYDNESINQNIDENSLCFEINDYDELVLYFTYLLPKKEENCCNKYTSNFCPECGNKLKL